MTAWASSNLHRARTCSGSGHTTPSFLNWQKLPCKLFILHTRQLRARPPRIYGFSPRLHSAALFVLFCVCLQGANIGTAFKVWEPHFVHDGAVQEDGAQPYVCQAAGWVVHPAGCGFRHGSSLVRLQVTSEGWCCAARWQQLPSGAYAVRSGRTWGHCSETQGDAATNVAATAVSLYPASCMRSCQWKVPSKPRTQSPC